MFDVKDAILNGMKVEDQRRNQFTVDRSAFLNASEADACIRKVWFGKRNPEQAFKPNGYSRRGHHVEDYVLQRLQDANVPLMWGPGSENTSLASEEIRLSATPDELVVPGDGTIIPLEIKSIDPRTNRRYLPKPQHVAQARVAMEMVRRHYPSLKVLPAQLIYIDASDYEDIIVFEIQQDDAEIKRVQQRAAKVFRTQDVSILDREGKRTGECKNCPFVDECGVALDDVEGGTVGKSRRGSTLAKAVEALAEIKDMKVQEKDLSETVKAELRKRGMAKMEVAGFQVTLSPVAGRLTLDKKAVEAAGIDLSPYQKTGAPSERLDVKRI